MNFGDPTKAEKFQEEYGVKGLRFMEFVLAQNVQLDVVKSAMQAAQEHNVDLAVEMLNTFTTVHADMTALFAGLADLTQEHAVKIFETANEEYSKAREEAVKPQHEGKTND